jgi:F-type H+-transporting ATPase subunit epsilon
MKLIVSTPTELVLDTDAATAVRAEDETGAFGILPGHTDFITALSVSVLHWHDEAGAVHYVAVRGGVLMVTDGSKIEVATREAVIGDDLARLQETVLETFRREAENEATERTETMRLHLTALRLVASYVSGKERGGHSSLPAEFEPTDMEAGP